ncbi:RHS repeat domain-containing protein, partial [Spartinivicinus poritis]
QVYFYHLDHLGTPQEISDARGNIVWSVQYRAYGNVARKQVEHIQNNLRFQGQYFDEETGLHYNRHRYYDPGLGRFINQDPIELLGGNNLYSYVQNPVHWIDPLGLASYVLIGEGQAAVEAYAKNMRKLRPNEEFRTIKKDWTSLMEKSGAVMERFGSKNWEIIANEANAQWIRDRHKEGYVFIDIGEDAAKHRSSFYKTELRTLEKLGAKVYKGASKQIKKARAEAPVSQRPISKLDC